MAYKPAEIGVPQYFLPMLDDRRAGRPRVRKQHESPSPSAAPRLATGGTCPTPGRRHTRLSRRAPCRDRNEKYRMAITLAIADFQRDRGRRPTVLDVGVGGGRVGRSPWGCRGCGLAVAGGGICSDGLVGPELRRTDTSGRDEFHLVDSSRTVVLRAGRAGLPAPHESPNQPGLRSGLHMGAPSLQVGLRGPWGGVLTEGSRHFQSAGIRPPRATAAPRPPTPPPPRAAHRALRHGHALGNLPRGRVRARDGC